MLAFLLAPFADNHAKRLHELHRGTAAAPMRVVAGIYRGRASAS